MCTNEAKMTNNEAIKLIEHLKEEIVDLSDNEIQALDLAIKAVKLMQLEDIDIDSTYWLYYDDNGNRRGEK